VVEVVPLTESGINVMELEDVRKVLVEAGFKHDPKRGFELGPGNRLSIERRETIRGAIEKATIKFVKGGFLKIQSIGSTEYNDEIARATLYSTALNVLPILEKRGLVVGCLGELTETEARAVMRGVGTNDGGDIDEASGLPHHALGYNQGKGEVIKLLLRQALLTRNGSTIHDGFRPSHSVFRTLIHELAHCETDEHDRVFNGVFQGMQTELVDLFRKQEQEQADEKRDGVDRSIENEKWKTAQQEKKQQEAAEKRSQLRKKRETALEQTRREMAERMRAEKQQENEKKENAKAAKLRNRALQQQGIQKKRERELQEQADTLAAYRRQHMQANRAELDITKGEIVKRNVQELYYGILYHLDALFFSVMQLIVSVLSAIFGNIHYFLLAIIVLYLALRLGLL